MLAPVLQRLPRRARRVLAGSAIERALRDALTVFGSFAFHRAPFQAFERRGAPRFPGERRLEVVEVREETPDAVSLFFERPEGAAHQAGQFLTFVLHVGGREVRRSYSLSSAPHEPRWRVTVKRVPGGLASAHLTEAVRVGDTLRTRGPSGTFIWQPADAPAHLLLVGGGSGVTPLFGIAKAALDADPDARVTLLLGNRSPRDVIFSEELASLAARHAGLRVTHVLETSLVDGAPRRIGSDELAEALGRADLDATRAYVCGPEPMMERVVAELAARGLDGGRVLTERFVSLRGAEDAAMKLPNARVTLRVTGREAPISPGQTLLEGALAAGLPLDFSCTMGGCAACVMRLVEGQVLMDEPNCLRDDERGAGLILTCVARPLTDVSLEPAS